MEIIGAILLRLTMIVVAMFAATDAAAAADGENLLLPKQSKSQAIGSLQSGVCHWRQGSLIHHSPTGATQPLERCRFAVRDPEFLDVVGAAPEIVELVKTNAHEGGAWYPDKNEFFFTSTQLSSSSGDARADLKKVNLLTDAVTVPSAASDEVPNGMVLDNDGHLLVSQQGSKSRGGFIQKIDLKTLAKTVVADNWFGVPFNSPNDVVVKRDGSIWFTDPSYGNVQGFRTAPKLNNQIYRISIAGVVDAVADGFTQPNGLAFSPDEKRLYVTDTGFCRRGGGAIRRDKAALNHVFDIGAEGVLCNRRLFASVGVYDGSSPGLGIPDGIKVDTDGRVYTGTVDGVQVFGRSGKALGLIRQPGVANLGFGGKGLHALYMLNDTTISFVMLQVKAAGLKYASMFEDRKANSKHIITHIQTSEVAMF